MEIKKGSIVARKSHNKDILFIVRDLLKSRNKKFAILNGLTIRIIADAPLEDLEIMSKEQISNEKRKLNDRLQKRIDRVSYKDISKGFRLKKVVYTGKILHLDGECCFVYTIKMAWLLGLKEIKKYKNAYRSLNCYKNI